MKKISKITLENFRVFSGKNEIDFNDTDGKPADLVCIYGKNGFGKTSLFDGFEWFFTGEIHLLNSVCSLSNLFFRFHTTTLTEACSNELKQHHL